MEYLKINMEIYGSAPIEACQDLIQKSGHPAITMYKMDCRAVNYTLELIVKAREEKCSLVVSMVLMHFVRIV